MAGTTPVPPSVDTVPASTRSAPSRSTAAAITRAVSTASEPTSASSVTCTAASAPMASILRSVFEESSGPTVRATISASVPASRQPRATSMTRSLISSGTGSAAPSRTTQPVSRLSSRSCHVSGTCLASTRIFTASPPRVAFSPRGLTPRAQ